MNPIVAPAEVGGLASLAWTWIIAFAPRLMAALLVLVIGTVLARWTGRGLSQLMRRTGRIDPTLRPVILAVVRYGIFIFMVVVLLNQLGIETTSLLTVLGAAGLAVGLALQGTLSNIAAGLMLLWLRPFGIGDYIEVNGQSGVVEETGLFSCILRTFDGARLFAPNSTLWNYALRNHSHVQRRLLAVSVTLANPAQERGAAAFEAALRADERVLKAPAPEVFVESMASANVTLTGRFWTAPAAYGEMQRSIVTLLRDGMLQAGLAAEDIQSIARVTPAATDVTRLIDL